MKKIEIYDYETNDTFVVIETNRRKNYEQDVISYLKWHNYNLLLQGKVTPTESDVYWLAYNKETKEQKKLWYRELDKNLEKESMEKDIVDDRI